MKFVILLHRTLDDYVTLFQVCEPSGVRALHQSGRAARSHLETGSAIQMPESAPRRRQAGARRHGRVSAWAWHDLSATMNPERHRQCHRGAVLDGVKGYLAALGGCAALDTASAPRRLAFVDGPPDLWMAWLGPKSSQTLVCS